MASSRQGLQQHPQQQKHPVTKERPPKASKAIKNHHNDIDCPKKGYSHQG